MLVIWKCHSLFQLFNHFLEITDSMRSKTKHSVTKRFMSRDISSKDDFAQDKKNSVHTKTQNSEKFSLGKSLHEVAYLWQEVQPKLSPYEWKIMNWHFANIEVSNIQQFCC